MKKLRLLSVLLAFIIAISFSLTVYAEGVEAEEENTVKVLFVGNSLTYYNSLPDIFSNLAKAGGVKVKADMCASGSYYLSYFASKTNTYGKKLREMLASTHYDYVVLQAHSTELLRLYQTSSLPAATTLVDLARANGAEPVLYMTWGLKDGYTYEQNGQSLTLDCGQMTEALARAYYRLGNELGVKTAPCGLNFLRFRSLYPDTELYHDDNKHPLFAGSYLSACTIYNTIFSDSNLVPDDKKTCLGIPYWYSPDGYEILITRENAEHMQAVADMRMEASASYLSIPVGSSAKYSAVLNVSSANELYKLLSPEGSRITYSSLDEAVAAINPETGKISAKGGGITLVKAQSDSGVSYYSTVEVKQPAKGISVSASAVSLDLSETVRLSASVEPENATNQKITWTSSDTSVAEVDEHGFVTAVKPGECNVTARTHNGYSAVCTVSVRLAKPENITVQYTSSAQGTGYANYYLSWKKVKDASKYLVYRSTSKNGTYKKVAEVKSASCTDKNLERGKMYYYRVYASVGKLSVRSLSSDIVPFMVPARVKLSGIKKTYSGKKKYVKLSWVKQSNISGYKIYRSNSKNGNYKLIKTVKSASKTSYTDKTTNKKKTYYYKVRSYVNINGNTIYGQYSAKKKTK